MKIVINAQYGGFSLSRKAIKRYFEIKKRQVWIEDDIAFPAFDLFTVWLKSPEKRIAEKSGDAFYEMAIEDRKAYNQKYSEQTWHSRTVERDDPILVQVVEELGEEANGAHATLKVVEVPDDVEWEISEYDGYEHVAEVHRTWG